MPCTSTTHLHAFTRPGPSSVVYEVPSPPYSSPYTTITLPVGSTWTSGLHWHETHNEYLQIISGVALITLNDVTRIYTSQDGVVTVPRYARHEWQRASHARDLGFDFALSSSTPSRSTPGSRSETQTATSKSTHLETPEEEALIVREWTSPTDFQKEIFFRNLNGIISHSILHQHADWYLTLQLWVLFARLDSWPVFFQARNIPVVGGWLERLCLGRMLEWVVCHVLLWGAVVLGRVLGVKGEWVEYTPELVERGEGKKEE